MRKILRLGYYPHHHDYQNHANEFRPFVTSFGQANYNSGALNTDQLGFRVQFDKLGKVVNFYKIKNESSRCNLLIGGSTAFGVDCSSDEKTFANIISQSGTFLINWGFRGAVCQQELIAYLSQKHLLPKIDNIIIFSGANDASLVCLNGEFAYAEWGSVFSEDYFFRQYGSQYVKQTRGAAQIGKVVSWIEKQFNLGGWRRCILNWLAGSQALLSHRNENVSLTESERLQVVIGHLKNTLETWGWVAKSTGVKIHYVLQPVAGWSTKLLSDRERKLITSDIEAIPELDIFASQCFYKKFKAALSEAFTASEIEFHDANEWLSDSRYDGEDIFTDSCHLNDQGNEIIAQLLNQHIFRK
jgi:hypothetical protein